MLISKGLGTLPPASTLIGTGLTATTGILSATGATAGILAAFGIGAQFVPIVGTIVGGIALVISALGLGNGCGKTCTESTTVVNNVEPYMQQNLDAANQQAEANGGCLTSAEVAVLTANWNQLWQYVVTNCGAIPAPGGTQCISDRQPGGKYDWTAYYLTPIQQIPVCLPTLASTASGLATNVGSAFGLNSNLVLAGGAALGIWLLSEIL
jgi:hypothetical protein